MDHSREGPIGRQAGRTIYRLPIDNPDPDMLDLQLLRHDGERVEHELATRGFKFDGAAFRLLEDERKTLQNETQQLQAQRNALSKEIGRKKSRGEDPADEMRSVAEIIDRLQSNETRLSALLHEIDTLVAGIPNLPHASVPHGCNAEDNVEIKRWGTPTAFDFPVRDHVDLGEALLGMDFEAGARISGARFSVLAGDVARLHRALAQFMLDIHGREHGYTEMYVPYLVNPHSVFGTGQLPKFEEDLFHVPLADGGRYYLIPTAEVPVTNLVRDRLLDGDALPLRYVCHSPCFRSEAGSYGRDTRGMIRQHQFDKVELVWIEHPERSWEALETLTRHAEAILERLELPYRRVLLCRGDMGFAAAKTYDLEVWLPAQSAWREISSCSNFQDFQSRRLRARYKSATGKNALVHTLNGSGLAIGRTLVAILENYQRADGRIGVPEALRSYLGGMTELKPPR